MLHKLASNPLLQPSLPAPAAPQTPKPPAVLAPPTKPFDAKNILNPQGLMEHGLNYWSSIRQQAQNPAAIAKATENVPPLQRFTPQLPESFQGPVNSALGFLQKGVRYLGPGNFTGVLGAAAPGLVRGLVSTPIGLPALLGLHGLLRGGRSFADVNTYFKPLMGRLGLR